MNNRQTERLLSVLPGVDMRMLDWATVYEGSRAGLIAAGLVQDGAFPGDLGQRKITYTQVLEGRPVRYRKTGVDRFSVTVGFVLAGESVTKEENPYQFSGLRIWRDDELSVHYEGTKAALLKHGVCSESCFPRIGTTELSGVTPEMACEFGSSRNQSTWVMKAIGEGKYRFTRHASHKAKERYRSQALAREMANKNIMEKRAVRFNQRFQHFMALVCGGPPRYAGDPPELLGDGS